MTAPPAVTAPPVARRAEPIAEPREKAAGVAPPRPEGSAGRGGAAATQHPVFLEDDERLIASVGRGSLTNFVLGSGFSRDYLVLSDRRVYFSGSSISVFGRMPGKTNAQVVIPLGHVSGVGFLERRNFWLLLIGGIIGLGGVMLAMMMRMNLLLGLIPGAVVLLVYFATIRHYYVISSASATISLSMSVYGRQALVDFSRCLGVALTASGRPQRTSV